MEKMPGLLSRSSRVTLPQGKTVLLAKTNSRAMATAPLKPVLPYIPALREFPTLQRFSAQRFLPFHPRKAPFLADRPPVAGRMLANLYHDLGVLVFAGADDGQVVRIGDILEQVTTKPGGVMQLWNAGDWHLEGKPEVKLRTYRINSEDVILEQDWSKQEGELSLEGLLQLTKAVFDEFAKETTAKAKGLRPEYDTIEFKLSDAYLAHKLRKRGIIHPTVNGPRRLQVDAHVYLYKRTSGRDALSLGIHFYTRATSQYLGSAKVDPEIFHTHPVVGRRNKLPAELIRGLFDETESLEMGTEQDRVDILARTWQLEKEIWTNRIQKEAPQKGKKDGLSGEI